MIYIIIILSAQIIYEKANYCWQITVVFQQVYYEIYEMDPKSRLDLQSALADSIQKSGTTD